MVIRRTEMKRKRRDDCPSPLLDDSPKRTKVHAQRKFAQGSNVNTPVITPVKELELEGSAEVLPEPVELLPIKRPNTEDFLTFLCFRGTPILPPSLNFFNTASIVDTNGQVHEIKSESPKNGPIDTSVIAKCGSPSEKPFIAFGVRKRADPIVISRQMDRKRRHALAIQALRRKYQEQKMAKIRALTISKLSEKVTNKTLVRTNSVSKTETVTKKTNTIQKTKVKVVATKHVKVTTQTLKTTLRPKRMCLRSFRGRFVQKELPFRNSKTRLLPTKKLVKKPILTEIKKTGVKKKDEKNGKDKEESEYSSEDDEPLSTPTKDIKITKKSVPKVVKKAVAPILSRSGDAGSRVTRSGHVISKVMPLRRPIKSRIIINPNNMVKPRLLRSASLKKTVLPQKLNQSQKVKRSSTISQSSEKESEAIKPSKSDKKDLIPLPKLIKGPYKKSVINLKKSTEIKKESSNKSEVRKESEVIRQSKPGESRKEIIKTKDVKKESNKSVEMKKESKVSSVTIKDEPNKAAENKRSINIVVEKMKKESNSVLETSKKVIKEVVETGSKASGRTSNRSHSKPTDNPEKSATEQPEKTTKKSVKKESVTSENNTKKETLKKEVNKTLTNAVRKPDVKQEVKPNVKTENSPPPAAKRKEVRTDMCPLKTRPTRKTKEAAAIYMELLSQKLVHDSKGEDDDNISIDSFPELPNVKKTEQRENELKAQAKSCKDDNKHKTKIKDIENIQDNTEKKLTRTNPNNSENTPTISTKTDKKVETEEEKINPKPAKSIEKLEQEETSLKKITTATVKRKSDSSVNEPVEDKVKKTKLRKPEAVETVTKVLKKSTDKNFEVKKPTEKEIEVPKMQTRHSNTKPNENIGSSGTVHTDIKTHKAKVKNNPLKTKTEIKQLENEENVIKKEKDITSKLEASSDSDQSTTSDINLKALINKAKNKKFSKTKSMKKENNFSDSDEEPLSKLTLKSGEGSQNSIHTDQAKKNTDSETKIKDTAKHIKPKVTLKKIVKVEIEKEKPDNVKPKRECAKRPQNYLAMLSSSSEEEYFHGFDNNKEINVKPLIVPVVKQCTHVPPSSDLLSKDISRRFGKGKVNMSNEQIEKWLKDSAMAGSSLKSENDELLKFAEIIPTETSLEIPESIDTQKLKSSLLTDENNPLESKQSESTNSPPTKNLTLNLKTKPQSIDRKLIFRKDKKKVAPNINAFSPENESSVYAFGEESEDVLSTPFRRPSRRPSSTATSRSEDESSKQEEATKAMITGQFRKPSIKEGKQTKGYNKDEFEESEDNSPHFFIPQNPTKPNKKSEPSPMDPPHQMHNKASLKTQRNADRISDLSEPYKIPSSPSASSSSSANLYKRQTPKVRTFEFATPNQVQDFPLRAAAAQLVQAPVFHPSDQEFLDPIEYIERIRHKAEQFGICKIVPPSSFKPECKVTDDMRFTAYNQYVHKMLHRWGPNFKELMAIKKYLSTQNISLIHPPWIGGMEIDLPRLYQTVQTLGGLKEVIEKKKWSRVSDIMKIPKSAQDRVTKLDDIYCKYLLPYDTLSPAEREKLFDEVETEWAKRESKGLLKAQQNLPSGQVSDSESDTDENEIDECIVKGRNMALNAFYRIARNTMTMHFKSADPTAEEVEQEFWKHVTQRQNHICVHSGSIDSGNWGYGFAVSKNSPFARHAWNLKVLTNNSSSVLRSMGPIMGVTVPTLHVGMVFSACCWYRDPHGLPWIEYLHTGGNKIWYGIPNSASDLFHTALKKLVPNYCRNKSLWLPSDTAMVPPSLLVENNVSLCRVIQEPGQFIVVFPKAFTSSLSTGYVVSESVYFAPFNWLKTAKSLFDDLKNSCEPSMFSLERLILSIAADPRSTVDVLRQIIPSVQNICDKEKELRDKIFKFGNIETEKLPLPEAPNARKRRKLQGEDGDYECEICRMNLFVSMVFDMEGDATYCLPHAVELFEQKKIQNTKCKLMFTYEYDEVDGLVEKIHGAIETKLQKKIPSKYAGLPTMLK